MKTEASVLIDRPIDEVFRMTTQEVSQWSDVVIAEETLEDRNEGGVGTTFRSTCKSNATEPMLFTGEVIKHDPPVLHVVRLFGEHFDIEAAYSFEAHGDQTRVTQFSKVNGKRFFAFMLTWFGWLMQRSSRKAAEKELNRLKQHCEASTARSA